MSKMRIVIADTRPKIRFALRAMLKRQTGLEIVGEARDAEDLTRQIEAVRPDAVLLDWRLDGLSMADLMVGLRKACPSLHVIVLSGRPEAQHAALAAGADVFVSKIDPPDRLMAAIGTVQRMQAALPSLARELQGSEAS